MTDQRTKQPADRSGHINLKKNPECAPGFRLHICVACASVQYRIIFICQKYLSRSEFRYNLDSRSMILKIITKFFKSKFCLIRRSSETTGSDPASCYNRRTDGRTAYLSSRTRQPILSNSSLSSPFSLVLSSNKHYLKGLTSDNHKTMGLCGRKFCIYASILCVCVFFKNLHIVPFHSTII